MLLAADRSMDEFHAEAPASSASHVRAASNRDVAAMAPALVSYGSRYGDRRPINLWAVSFAVILHIVLIAAVMHVRSEGSAARHDKLTVVDLSSPPPPPPPASSHPPAKQPPVTAPPPRIAIPHAAPPMAVSPVVEPQPAPVTFAAPAPAPPSVATAPAAPAPPSVVESGSLGTKMISGSPPRYPMESRRKREQGTVVLSLTLSVDGGVSVISVAQSSGFDRLDDAALRAVRKWRWAPTVRNGQPVMVRGQVEIPFVLQG